MWENSVERGKLEMLISRMCVACCKPKATNTHSEYVTLTAFPLQQWLYERPLMLCYAYIVCLANVQINGKYWPFKLCALKG